MTSPCAKINLMQWDSRYDELSKGGLVETDYGGRLSRHLVTERDLRLNRLEFDNSAAALRLWNFLLTENQRLRAFRDGGGRLVGAMKDLGTVPVIVYAIAGLRAFYPDGAWWTPCLMECSDGLLQQAEQLGISAAFCPVRAMLPAFLNEDHFPRPDLLICSTGAVCDDFSAIAQRLEKLGFPVTWWEMPRRRAPEPSESVSVLPGGLSAPRLQVDCVRAELERIGSQIEQLAGAHLDDAQLFAGISEANRVRALLASLRTSVYGGPSAPLPALEMLIAEMLAIHFCSDRDECIAVLSELLAEVQARLARGVSVVGLDGVRIFWVNPVADLRIMNLLEIWGGRLCGSDFMFTHALDPIPQDGSPYECLARSALADSMVGSTSDRAMRIVADCRRFDAEALVVSRIPGASHCAHEGVIIREAVERQLGIPSVEIEVPPVCDPLIPTLSSRLQALIETARNRRRAKSKLK
jgi:hypothetical protein